VAALGFIVMNMSLVFSMLIYYDVKGNGHRWHVPFELPNTMQVMYAWTTFNFFSDFRIENYHHISNMHIPQLRDHDFNPTFGI